MASSQCPSEPLNNSLGTTAAVRSAQPKSVGLRPGFPSVTSTLPSLRYRFPIRFSNPVRQKQPPPFQLYNRPRLDYRHLQSFNKQGIQTTSQNVVENDLTNIDSYKKNPVQSVSMPNISVLKERKRAVVDKDSVGQKASEEIITIAYGMRERIVNRKINKSKSKSLAEINSSSFRSTVPDVFLLCYWKIYSCSPTPQIHFWNNNHADSLSKDIWRNYLDNQMTMKTFSEKIEFWKQMCSKLLDAHSLYDLQIVGSVVSGFGNGQSDLNLMLVTESRKGIPKIYDAIFHLSKVSILLDDYKEVEDVETAEPQNQNLTFTVNKASSFKVVITANNYDLVLNSQLMYSYVKSDWRVQPLYSVIKGWADRYGICSTKGNRGEYISSYSLQILLIMFLTCGVSPPVVPMFEDIVENLTNECRKDQLKIFELCKCKKSGNEMSLGELFFEWLKFYENFDFTNNVISIKQDYVMSKSEYYKENKTRVKTDVIYIEDVIYMNNTASSVNFSKISGRIKDAARKARESLSSYGTLKSLFY